MTDINLDICTCGCVVVSDAQAVAALKSRNEQLEAALKKIAGEPPKGTWDEGLYWWAVEIAEASLAGEKKDE